MLTVQTQTAEAPRREPVERDGPARGASNPAQVAVRDRHGGVAGWVIAPVSRDVFGRNRGTVFMDRP